MTEPTVAVAVKPKAVDHLPAAVREQIELRKMMNAVAAEISNLSWGKGLSDGTRRALASWGREYNVDPTTEIHLLGGRVYLNAAFFLRKLSGMIDAGLIEYAYADHVNADARLGTMGEPGQLEAARRQAERVRHNVPEEAKAAVVFRVKVKSMSDEVTGTKWAGGGTRKNDPVGDQFPVESAESRAARRCMRQLASHVPTMAAEIEATASAAEQLEPAIEADKLEVKVPGLLGKAPLSGDGYADEEPAP